MESEAPLEEGMMEKEGWIIDWLSMGGEVCSPMGRRRTDYSTLTFSAEILQVSGQ